MNVGIRWCHECYTSLCHNVTQVEDPLPCARRSIDLFAKKNSFHFNTKIEKPTHWFYFWTSTILSVWSNDDNHYTLSIFTSCLPTFPPKIYGVADTCTAEEVDMQLKFTFFFNVISRSFFTENPMVDPWIKWRKSKDRAKKLNRCWESDFWYSLFSCGVIIFQNYKLAILLAI